MKGKTKAVAIRWDRRTLVRVQDGTYGRMIRLRGGGDILCSYEAAGKSWVTHSRDNGRTWGDPVLVHEMPYAAAANPEIVQLKSGRVLLFFNQRPRDGKHRFAIGFCGSDDDGRTWRRPAARLLYEAGADFKNGCWEPAALQLPSGELQVFFANEAPYTNSDEQEITLLRSRDDGATWGRPETVSFRAGHRDGMPVPLLLRDTNGRPKGLVCAIEDNGLTPGALLQPAVIHTPLDANWKQPVINGNSPRRWSALAPPLPGRVYAGAPYLRQFPGGETVLSCQSDEGGRKEPQMVVYLGDSNARNFGHRSVPIELPPDVGGRWNALFIKDADTVTALTPTVVNGRGSLWAIDGRLVREGERR